MKIGPATAPKDQQPILPGERFVAFEQSLLRIIGRRWRPFQVGHQEEPVKQQDVVGNPTDRQPANERALQHPTHVDLAATRFEHVHGLATLRTNPGERSTSCPLKPVRSGTGPASRVAVLKHSSRVDVPAVDEQVRAGSLLKKRHDL